MKLILGKLGVAAGCAAIAVGTALLTGLGGGLVVGGILMVALVFWAVEVG